MTSVATLKGLDAGISAYSSPSKNSSALPPSLRYRLWECIVERLERGESLIFAEQYMTAMEEDYQTITQAPLTPSIKAGIERMISAVNEKYPELFVARGVQNGFHQAFAASVRKLHWNTIQIQARGVRALKRFSRADTIGDLLDEVNVRRSQIDVIRCVQHVVETLEGKPQTASDSQPGSPAAAQAPLELQPSQSESSADSSLGMEDLLMSRRSAASKKPPSSRDAGALSRKPVDGPNSNLGEERQIRQQEHRQQELEQREWEKVLFYMPSYVEQEVVTEEEAEQFQTLREIDQREQQREIEHPEAEVLRDEVLPVEDRAELEKKVRKAVGESVKYLQVFESLKKISPDYDKVLRFLIKYKEAVVSDNPLEDRTPAMAALIKNRGLLNHLTDIVARKNSEIRLLAVRLPPYLPLMGRELEKIANLTVERSFIKDLRTSNLDEFSERLNSLDRNERVKPAADLRSFLNLVDHVVQPTRFREKIVMLKVGQVLKENESNLEDIILSAAEPGAAARQAERFINQRLERIFPDLSDDEKLEVQQRCAAYIRALELRLSASGNPGAEQDTQRDAGGPEDPSQLTDEEKKMGLQMGRVEMRVAGKTRLVPQKLMPDPDDPEKSVIAARDPDSGQLVPQLRRGVKRYVEKNREGHWKINS